jgi:hypothetical protein
MLGGAAKTVAIAATGGALARTGMAEEAGWREGGSRVAGDDVERRYFYRASARALSGEMRSPFRWTIEPQAVATLAAGGGRSSIRRGRFDAVTGASFESAESRVSGHRRSDGAYETVAEVVIEGLDLLGLVTADRIAAHLRGLYLPGLLATSPVAAAVGELALDAPFTAVETELLNLRVLEVPVSLPSRVPDVSDPLSAAGYRIPIPEVGDLYVGEYRTTPASRRLTMLRLVLHGRLQGELVGGVLETNGCSWP